MLFAALQALGSGAVGVLLLLMLLRLTQFRVDVRVETVKTVVN